MWASCLHLHLLVPVATAVSISINALTGSLVAILVSVAY